MIYLKEAFPDEHSVTIRADGYLDSGTIPILKMVCERHLEIKRKVILIGEGLIHISREGREFLLEMEKRGIITNPSSLIQGRIQGVNDGLPSPGRNPTKG